MVTKPAPFPRVVGSMISDLRRLAVTVDDDQIADRLMRAAAVIEGAEVEPEGAPMLSEQSIATRIAILRWAAARMTGEASAYEDWSKTKGGGSTIAMNFRHAAGELEQMADELAEPEDPPPAADAVMMAGVLENLAAPVTATLELRVRPASIVIDKPPTVRDAVQGVLNRCSEQLTRLLSGAGG